MDYSWVPKGSLASLAPDCQIGKVASFQSGSVWPFREISSLVKCPIWQNFQSGEISYPGGGLLTADVFCFFNFFLSVCPAAAGAFCCCLFMCFA